MAATGAPRTTTAGWRPFAAWGLVGALLGFSAITSPSIGLFVLPLALLALGLVAKHMRVWPEVAGALEGIAAVAILVGLLNLGSDPCPATGSGTARPGSRSSGTACGGFDPSPWLTAGVAFALAGVLVHLAARRRS